VVFWNSPRQHGFTFLPDIQPLLSSRYILHNLCIWQSIVKLTLRRHLINKGCTYGYFVEKQDVLHWRIYWMCSFILDYITLYSIHYLILYCPIVFYNLLSYTLIIIILRIVGFMPAKAQIFRLKQWNWLFIMKILKPYRSVHACICMYFLKCNQFF
jgi:hypothetical protein